MKSRDEAFFTAVQQEMQTENIQTTPTVLLNGKEVTGTTIADVTNTIENAVTQGAG